MVEASSERIPKDMLERRVATDFLHSLFPVDEISEVRSTQPPEPDVLGYVSGRYIGIKLCALVSESEVQASVMEADFLKAINEAVEALDWPDVRVGLVMQDDGDLVIHEPARGFEKYALLPAYLDGILVHLGLPGPGQSKVRLNQRSSNRPAAGLFPRRDEIKHFASELVAYVSTLREADFQLSLGPGLHFHHAVTADMVGRQMPVPRNRFASVARKLSGVDKYRCGLCQELWLVVHNLPQDSRHAIKLWHEYWHYRQEIVSALRMLIEAVTEHPFDRVYFADYSEVPFRCRVHVLPRSLRPK